MKKRTVFLWGLISIFLSACVYFSLPQKLQKKSETALTPEEIQEAQIEAFFKSRPVRDVPSDAAFGAYLAGNMAKQSRDFKAAADYFAIALEKDPTNPELKASSYLLFVLGGDVERAIPYAKDILVEKPDELLPNLVLFSQVAKEGKWKEAEKYLSADKTKSEAIFLIPLLKAWMKAAQNNEKAALAELKPMLGEEALKPLYLLHRGLILDYLGETQEAAKAFDSMLEIPQGRSIRSLLIMRNFEERTGALKNKALFVELYQSLRDESFVSRELMARSVSHERVLTPAQGIALVFFDVAGSVNELGSTETALFLAQLSLYLNPSSSITKFFTGELLENLARFVEANALYETVQPEDDIYLSVQIRKNVNFVRQGQLKEAARNLEEVINLYPDIPIFNMTLGDVYRQNGQCEKALEQYKKALKYAKKDDTGIGALYFSSAVCYQEVDDWPSAEEALLKAIAVEPDNALYLNYLGYSYLEKGEKLDEAFAMVSQAAEKAPYEGSILDSLGWAYYLRGDYDKAVEILEKAVDLQAGNALINAHLGDAYWRVGRKREAVFQWEHALTLKQELTSKLEKELHEKIENGLSLAPKKN